MAYRDQPLGELALSIPRASALFRKYDMDYCCGGKQTLARAAARKELDVEVIEAELAKLAEQPIEKDWRSAPLAEIIDHIIVRYHDRHREQLPELILQATKVERVHADKPSVPKGLTKYLTMLHEELSSHMMKEEQILFPMIKQGMGSQAMGPISVMESEHDEAGELLEVIKHTTNNVTPPPEACTTWKAMYNGINELIDDPRWNGYEVPPTSNANYGWILNIVSKLSQNGVAGFLLANGALSDDGTELKIRKQLIENNLVEAIIILPRNLFYTTDISVTLWILNRNKKARVVEQNGQLKRYRNREREILFMDLRQMGSPYEKKYIELTEEDRAKVTSVYHNWQQEGYEETYKNVPEFCYSASFEEVQKKGFTLVPSIYIEFINLD